MSDHDQHRQPGGPRPGHAHAPRARWTKVHDAVLRSPVLTAEQVRAYAVLKSLIDSRRGHWRGRVSDIARLARLDREVAKAALEELARRRLVRYSATHCKDEGGAVWRWEVPEPSAQVLASLSRVPSSSTQVSP